MSHALLRQRQTTPSLRLPIVILNQLREGHVSLAQTSQMLARGVSGNLRRVLPQPLLKPRLSIRGLKRKSDWGCSQIATPWLRRQPGAKRLLHFAKPDIKRIGPELFQN